VKAENHKAEETANSRVDLRTNDAIPFTGRALEERSIPREDERRVTSPMY